MIKERNYSIRQKLTWMNMLVSGAALLLACTVFAAYELAEFRATLVSNLSIQAHIVGANSASALLFNDPESAENTLSALNGAPHICPPASTPPLAIYSHLGARGRIRGRRIRHRREPGR